MPGITARDLFTQLGDNPSNALLAETIALANAKVGHLMHLTEDDSCYEDELEEWLALEGKLYKLAVASYSPEEIALTEGQGMMRAIAPFMNRNGYEDACGWWMPINQCQENEAECLLEGVCPKCGAELKGFIEGSTMGSRCTKCNWSVVTTYVPPIQEDESDYTIMLMKGCVATKETLGTISRISMCNYLEAKELIASAPVELFVGRATQLIAHICSLEEAGIPFDILPDFPYDKKGQLVDEIRLNTLLLETFPELAGEFQEYTSWQDGMETGCFLTYEDVFRQHIETALHANDVEFLDRSFSFIEYLMTSEDAYAVNLATVGLLEGLKANVDNDLVRPHLGPFSLQTFNNLYY